MTTNTIARILVPVALATVLVLSPLSAEAKKRRIAPTFLAPQLTEAEQTCAIGGVLTHAMIVDFQRGVLLSTTLSALRTLIPSLFPRWTPQERDELTAVFVGMVLTVYTDGQTRDAAQAQRAFEIECLRPRAAPAPTTPQMPTAQPLWR